MAGSDATTRLSSHEEFELAPTDALAARLTPKIVDRCRAQFPALARRIDGRQAIFFDGPAGSQVPQRVVDQIGHYLSHHNANHGGKFTTSVESDAVLEEAHRGVADLLGASDPATVLFGPNATTHVLALSRSLARTWRTEDEIVVTRLDHDANVTPWVLAARDAGARVQYVEVNREDCTLNMDDLRSKLSEQTRLVAVGCASNASGSINSVPTICQWAAEVGALSFVDAVHYAPHALIDVGQIGCDFLVCSAYKFFGPHIGVLWGRRQHLEELTPYKLRPATEDLPGKWMTGTQNHECIAGTLAAVEYLADLGCQAIGRPLPSRRIALQAAFAAIRDYERQLVSKLLDMLESIRGIQIYGITDRERLADRLPTVALTHERWNPEQLATELAKHAIFTWHGNFYALQLSETLGLEPTGMLRIGLLHYNTPAEIEACASVLESVC